MRGACDQRSHNRSAGLTRAAVLPGYPRRDCLLSFTVEAGLEGRAKDWNLA